MSDVVPAQLQTGQAFFAYCHDRFDPEANPRLLGWFVDDDGTFTVAFVNDDEVIFVTGPARREGLPPS